MNHRAELCLFLSSTFLDMGPEREYLMKQVFPELRQLCRERGVTLTEIDLRWGITESQGRRGRIVTACLDEILRRRPFILALVGDRYGWRPSLRDLNDPSFVERFPWIWEGVKEEKSLVELETLEVASHDAGMRDRIRFYFKRKHYRRYSSAKKITEEDGAADRGDEEEIARLNAFYARVRHAGLPIREGYRTPSQLGEWVREDVLAILNAIAPEGKGVDSWIARERWGHEAYARTRRRAYIDHEPSLQALDDYVLASYHESEASSAVPVPMRTLPLIVTGESGAGKSALLARWSARHRERFPDAFLIEHYVGATPSSSDRYALMRRVMSEIRDRYGLTEELPASPELIVEVFPSWLARLRNESLVIVVDALDRLDNSDTALSSFPLDFPVGVRVLFSTVPGAVLDQGTERGWKSLSVVPLAEGDRGRAIRAYLAEFSKRLEPEQVRRIATDGKSANPLYLRTSLEELRLHGEHETLNAQIDHYLSAGDPRALFGLVLERLEKDFGKRITATALSCLWASRGGLSETELAEILAVPFLKFRPLIQGMQHHLTRIDGRLNFCHDHLRQAVVERYLPSRVRRRNMHRRIGVWFAAQPVSLRRAEEEPWQWKEGEEWGRLSACLANVELLATMLKREGDIPMHLYRRMLPEGDQHLFTAMLQTNVSEFLVKEAYSLNDKIRILRDIGRFLQETTEYQAAEVLLTATQNYAVSQVGDSHSSLAPLYAQIGMSLQLRGDYDGARVKFRKALEVCEDPEGNDLLIKADLLDSLASLLYTMREYQEAEVLMRQALELRQGQLGPRHGQTAFSIMNIGALYYAMGRYEKAERLLKDSLELSQGIPGNQQQLTAMVLNNLAAVYRGTGEHEKAIPLLNQALAINEAIYGQHHPDAVANLSNLGYFQLSTARHSEAEGTYRKVLEVCHVLHGPTHPVIATALINLGTALVAQQKLDEAEGAYHEALAIRLAAFGDEHLSTHTCWLNIAGVLLDKGETGEALKIFRRSLPIKESILGRDHPDVLLSYERLEQYRLTL